MTGDPELRLLREQNEILKEKVALLQEQNEILKEKFALLQGQNKLLRHLCEDAIGWLKQIDRDIRDK